MSTQTSGPTGYEHLTPLLAELARLPPDDPRRRPLRAEIITGYLPVAKHIARKHAYRGEDLDDLEQVAALGLIHAVDRFEPDRGSEFLAFAVPTVNGEVLRHYRDRAAPVRMPRRLQALQGVVTDALDELSQRLGRAPEDGELARELDLDRTTVADVLHARDVVRCASLDAPVGNDGAPGGRRGPAALGRVDRRLDLVEDRVSLAPLMDALPERERRILLLRFVGGLTQTEIAQWIGCSQMHVSRLLSAALADLQKRLRDGGAGGTARMVARAVTSTAPAVDGEGGRSRRRRRRACGTGPPPRRDPAADRDADVSLGSGRTEPRPGPFQDVVPTAAAAPPGRRGSSGRCGSQAAGQVAGAADRGVQGPMPQRFPLAGRRRPAAALGRAPGRVPIERGA